MTTRRQFFRSLAIGTATLYLRFAPDAVWAVEKTTLWDHLESVYAEIILKRVWETNPYARMLEEKTFR